MCRLLSSLVLKSLASEEGNGWPIGLFGFVSLVRSRSVHLILFASVSALLSETKFSLSLFFSHARFTYYCRALILVVFMTLLVEVYKVGGGVVVFFSTKVCILACFMESREGLSRSKAV